MKSHFVNHLVITVCLACVLVGCSSKTTPRDSEPSENNAGIALSSVIAVPLPSGEELELMGKQREVVFRWQLDSPTIVVSIAPQRILQSAVITPYTDATEAIIRQLPLFPRMFDALDMEKVLVSSRVEMISVGNATGGAESLQPFPVRVSEITLASPTTPEQFFQDGFSDLPIDKIPLLSHGTHRYYDVGAVANVPSPLVVAIAFPEPKTVIVVEGNSQTLIEVFNDSPAQGAAWDRLARIDFDNYDFNFILSREGGTGPADNMTQLFSQFNLPESLIQAVAEVKAISLTAIVAPKENESFFEWMLAASSIDEAKKVDDAFQGWLVSSRVAMASATPADSAAFAQPFWNELLSNAAVTTNETLVRITIPQVASWEITARIFLERQEKQIFFSELFTRMNTLARAFIQYRATNGFFPHRGICAADGTPLLSWRVALLPLLGMTELFEKFDRTQAWDSEQNKPLAAQMPAIFALPREVNVASEKDSAQNDDAENSASDKTTFRLFNSPGTPFGNPELRIEEITHPTTTVMLVSVDSAAAVVWTAPDLLDCTDTTLEAIFPKQIVAILWNGQNIVSDSMPCEQMREIIEGKTKTAETKE